AAILSLDMLRNDAASLLAKGADLDRLLGAVIDEAIAALDAERGTLFLVDRARRELFSKVAHLSEMKEIRLPLGRGIAGKVAEDAQAMRIDDPYAHPLFNADVDKRTGYKTRSILAAPLTDAQGEVI